MSDNERTAAEKARESWQMFTIMAEFIEATEPPPKLQLAVSICDAARVMPKPRQ